MPHRSSKQTTWPVWLFLIVWAVCAVLSLGFFGLLIWAIIRVVLHFT